MTYNAHVTRCAECGTSHVCPGPLISEPEITVDYVKEFLVGRRVLAVEIFPLLDEWAQVKVTTDDGVYEWNVSRAVMPEVQDLLVRRLRS